MQFNVYAKEGTTGTVVLMENTGFQPYLIEWDKDVCGHNGLTVVDNEIVRVYRSRDGHCEWVNRFHIRLIDESIGQITNISKSLDGFFVTV